jgi:gamma-glutamyltranspeptidase
VAIGGAGGNRIVTNLARIVRHLLEHPESLAAQVALPRAYASYDTSVHREWFPGLEKIGAFPSETVRSPGADYFGLVSAVASTPEGLLAVGDFRRDGAAGAIASPPPSIADSR